MPTVRWRAKDVGKRTFVIGVYSAATSALPQTINEPPSLSLSGSKTARCDLRTANLLELRRELARRCPLSLPFNDPISAAAALSQRFGPAARGWANISYQPASQSDKGVAVLVL